MQTVKQKSKSSKIDGLIESYENSEIPRWVLVSAAEKIARSKIPVDCWEDFLQECAIWFIKSEQKKHLYSRVRDSTRICAGINIIYKKFLNRLRKESLLQPKYAMTKSEVITIDLIRIADEAPLTSLQRAVRRAVAGLDEEKQLICGMIMDMLDPHEICRKLGKSHWYYKRQIHEIRREFCRRGILEIIIWRRDCGK